MTLSTRGARPAARCRRDDGTALVEFSIVMVLLLLLVFGIINFGLFLSFKQDVTRAAAEGARVGAVAFPATGAWAEADQATKDAVDGFDRTCGVDGTTCNVNLHSCATPVADGTPSNPASTGDCVTVEIVYRFVDDPSPLGVPVPIISAFRPDVIRAKSVARLNQ